jgi:hypothetical protein
MLGYGEFTKNFSDCMTFPTVNAVKLISRNPGNPGKYHKWESLLTAAVYSCDGDENIGNTNTWKEGNALTQVKLCCRIMIYCLCKVRPYL